MPEHHEITAAIDAALARENGQRPIIRIGLARKGIEAPRG